MADSAEMTAGMLGLLAFSITVAVRVVATVFRMHM
jgi:hypothetical protein